MSSSGYRGRSFGPRGARTNGPANGFNGPRFPHPTFNHPRPPHRLSGPNFVPWQQNKNFHPQYRGNLQYHPNSRGRAAGGRGIVRFSSRPPLPQFRMGFIRTPVHTVSLLHRKEQVEDESVLTPQTPLPGSEEERQQKIAETADKLKKKLSSITEEELTNFWEDDLSVLPNNEEEDIPNRGIPELRHDPPELDLTFTDFKDIGRIDCNNLKCGNLDSKLSNEISISFEKKPEHNVTSTNNEIIIIDESREEPIIILDSCEKDDLNRSNVSAEDDKCEEQVHRELPDLERNVENLQLQSSDITGNLTSSSNVDEKLSTLNVDENITNLLPTESVDNSSLEKILDVNDVKMTVSTSVTTNNQDELKIDFPQDQNTVQADIQDQNSDINSHIAQDTDTNVQHNDRTEEKLHKVDQIQNCPETNVPQEVIDQNVKHVSEEIHLNIVCDPASSTYLNYNDANKLNDDRKSNNPFAFQSKVFNVSPRFTSRTEGPRCHWTFQQNVTNSFFRGPQRLSFHHGNRIFPPKHVTSFKPTDLVSVGFHPRTLPPFIRNISVSSYDTQHNSIVPFSSNDLPPVFDPSEPPPNIKSKSGTNSLNKQEDLRSMPREKISRNISKVIEPSSAFDPRRPSSIRIPYVSVTIDKQIPGFNPQQPPPKIHKREKTLQPPPIFDSRLFSQERSSLVVPLDASRSNVVPLNLMETSSVPDFNIGPVTPNFPRLSSINIPSHRPFMSNVQTNFPSVMSQTSGGQGMTKEFSLRLPPMTITEVPPPPPKEPSFSMKGNSNPNQGINMDDGLEDMQEAMEFAKQIMNLTEEVKNSDTPVSDSALTPAEIPVPIEIVDSLFIEERNASSAKKQRRKEGRSKKNRQNVVACGPKLSGSEKQEDIETTDKRQTVVENQSKSTEDALLSNDQIRPKVMFNLNSKTKKIHKAEEWHRTTELNVSENREISQRQETMQNLNKDRSNSRKHHPFESRDTNTNQSRNQQQKEMKIKKNFDSQVAGISTQEKSSNAQSHCQKSHRDDSEKLQENATTLAGNLAGARKSQKPREESRKERALTSESLWKSRVISRFLKMSKNDICNMVNNSSLRKFDIAMKHLVKERKSSLSLELRNVEDEKMKEYDRIEFMNQLNAMLDPSAVVGITDLPTEFIHHLSEVLQLDIPFDAAELPQSSNVEVTKVTSERESSSSESPRAPSFAKCSDTREHNLQLEKLSRGKEDPDHHHRASDDANSLVGGTEEGAHKKQQQPLFNEADLDDILSQVAERTRTLSTTSLPAETIAVDSSAEVPSEGIANRTVADLDDIFSAGIVRARQLGSSNNASVDHSRARKSSSADRNSSPRYERWNRKARQDPDTFRNLTKEEWEVKYGGHHGDHAPAAGLPPRRNASSSAENLSNRAQRHRRHCFSDSPARRSSMSPLTREVIPTRDDAADKCVGEATSDEMEQAEKSGSSSSSSFSDSDSDSESDRDGEETMAPNVTKLLKVIKEKEKIAKKRSLNETIRDEVAAEIEKEWKEKSRHKERRSRKRERRKRDRREERRRERRRKRRRDSDSGSRSRSRSDSGQVKEFRLLIENEIKREVKEECTASTFEGNSSSTGGVASSNNKAPDSRNESQGLRAEKDQQVSSTLACNEQTRNKPSTVVSPTQPKTKAQLKQMPESNQITEEVTEELAKSTERTWNPLDVNKEVSETARSCSEQIDKDVQTLRQTAPLPVKESSSFLQSISNNMTRAVTHANNSTSNTVFDGNADKHDQRACTRTCCPLENKSGGNGYRKIDIKAYKERALQRRLKELDASSFAPRRSSHATSKSNVESGSSKDDASKEQTKDPRLIKARSTTNAEESDKGAIEKRSCSQHRGQSADVVAQRTKEGLSVPARSTDTDSNAAADTVKSKSKERGGKLASSRREFDEPNPDGRKVPMGLNSARRRPRRPITSAVDTSKFKNIRSEGNKELKLIKEKARSSNEKRRRRRRSRFSSKLENSIVESSCKNAAEKSSEKLPLIAGSRKVASRSEIEKVSSCRGLSKLRAPETCSGGPRATTIDRNGSTSQKRIDDRSIARRNNHVAFVGNNRDKNVTAFTRVDNELIIVPNRQVVSQKGNEEEEEEDEDGSLLTSLAKRRERNVAEASMSVESTPVESSSSQRDVCNDASSTNSTPLGHDESIPAEKCTRGAAPPASDRVARESHHLLSERIDVDIEKHGHRINVRNFMNDEASSGLTNSVSLETNVDDGTSVVEKTADSERAAREQRDPRSDDSDEVRDKARSPSPCSPFKGFLVDTVDNDIYQVSRLCRARAENESIKENSTKEQGDSSQRLQTNQPFNDESVVESGGEDGNGGDEKVAGNGEALSISNLEEVVDDPCVKDDGKVESEEATKEDDRGYDFPSGQKKFLSVAEITDDHDTFNEPFIVLDEYIDDTDGRSIERFNSLPDLDIFTTKPLLGEKEGSPDFDEHEFSRPFDKDRDATAPVCENERATLPRTEDEKRALELFADKSTSVFSSISASNVELNSETAVPESLAEYSQNVVDTTDEDSSQKDTAEKQKSVRERKIGEEREDVSGDESSQKLDRNENLRDAAPKTQQVKDANADLPSTRFEEVRTLVKELTVNSAKSGGRDESRVLNNVRNKPRMKRKKEKRISEKLTREAARVKHPTTKEAVMARMIEIDVEIHKLMTEKMTLYQMLTSDNNSQQSNAENKEKLESPVIRPQTPSLMSQLLQNIDAAPATKTAYEKDSSVNPNRSNTLGKHNNHHAERKESCVSVYDSENEEVDGRSSRKRKRQKPERSVKRSDERKQSDDNAIKVTCKRDDNARRAAPVEQSPLFSEQILTSQTTKLQENVGKDSSKSQVENEKEIVPEFNGGNCAELARRNSEEKNETSGRESNDAESTAEKLSESKTPERLSIYSDDSTWDSFLQNSGADDQKKPSTGLALLEETYRKEMAKARRMREKMRKRKKKKLGNMLRTVNALTSDEEELPLATLYAKKLHRKRRLLDSFEQRAKQQSSDCTSTVRTSDPQLWKNVVEVINAVAENRTDDLYVEEPSTEKISTDTETTEAIVLNSGGNVESKNDEGEQIADSSTLKAVEESSTELVKISENDSKKDDLRTILSNKSQELPNSEHSQQDLETSAKDLPETSTDEVDLVEFSVQRTVASDSVEINRTTEDLDSCNTELNLNNIADDRSISNVSEHPEKLEEKIDAEIEKFNLKDESIVAQAPVDRQFVTKPKETKKCSGIPLESDSDKNVAVADEITSKGKPDDSELENASESNVQDPLPLYSKNNAIGEVKCSKDSAVGDSNCVPQDKQHFIGHKEHKEHREPRKRKDTERFDKTSSEENNNQSSSRIESTEVLKEDEVFLDKKLLKRKRGSSKIPVRRSSRYTEEPAKRIKVEADTARPIAKQDEKNFRTQFPCALSTSSSSCEELESILVNPKKCRGVQKPTVNRKRCTPTLSEIEAAPHELSSESFKGIKRHRKRTMFEMLNCVVRLVDCRETILSPNVSSNVLQKYSITRVNTHCTKSLQTDALISSTQSTLTKDSPTVCAKQTPHEPPQSQASKSMKKIDDAARCATDQTSSTNKVKRVTKLAKVDLPVNDTKEYESPDIIEVMPVLVNELVTMDIAQNCENSDVEIVEERFGVIKSEQHSNSESPTTVIDAREDKEQARTQYTVHKGPILDIKVFENSFLAASEDGRIYRYNQASNGILNIYKGHKAAVTCLYVYNVISTDISKEWMFSGSLDGTLRCYNIMTGIQARDTADIGSPIQCMDEAWGIIFIGTKSGHVSRYHVKTGVIKGDSIQFSDKSVLALKATNEGPRRVLIVASRSQPITIRDAQSGLFLRTICGQKSHTVYSLMRNNNLIYCGTSSTSIPVFDFTNGEQTMQYNAGVGIVCMRLYKQLLFAGCYDGNIYVFDTKDHQYLCSIPGPGNMLLSMEVIDNKIIAGSKDKRLQSWQMPRQVRSLLQKVNQA